MNPRLRRGGRNHNHNNNGNNNHNNGGFRRNNVISRNTVLDSLGPSGKLRGTAYQLMEKYLNAAKDFMATDRVAAENCLQHADHYMRLNAMAIAQENQNRFNNNNAQQSPRSQSSTEENAVSAEKADVSVAENETEAEDTAVVTETTDYAKMDLSVPVSLMGDKAVQVGKEKALVAEAQAVVAEVPVVMRKRRGRPAKKKPEEMLPSAE